MPLFLLALLGAYLVGSVNFAILLFRLLGREDPRTGFSGNPGVSNVYRLAGPGWAGAVLCLDLLRAMGVAWVSLRACSPPQVPWCALALVAGNMLPAFHRFRGGKGVANSLGFTAVAAPWAALLGAWLWVLVFGITRRPFLGSFGMMAALGAGLAWRSEFSPPGAAGALLLLAAVAAAHRGNLAALRSGAKETE